MAVAFVFATTIGFADDNSVETTSEEVVTSDGSIEVSLSCGVEGTLSWTGNPSLSEVMSVVADLEEEYCG